MFMKVLLRYARNAKYYHLHLQLWIADWNIVLLAQLNSSFSRKEVKYQVIFNDLGERHLRRGRKIQLWSITIPTLFPKHHLDTPEAISRSHNSQPNYQLLISEFGSCSPFVPIHSWSCSSLKVNLTFPPDLLYMPDNGTAGSRSYKEATQ